MGNPSPNLSELVASLNNRAQNATSAAQAIADPTVRKAITELAGAVREISKHLKRTGV